MNNVRRLIQLLLISALSASILLVSQSCKRKEKIYTVGIINPSSGLHEVVTGFKQGMEELGYAEGRNITYIYDGPLGKIEKADEKIDEMIALDVDLIYSLTTPASIKLKTALAGTDIPGVFGPVFDPVSAGVIESQARPGGQLTGVMVRGSTPKALEWLLAIVPDTRRIFVPFHKTDKAAFYTVEDLRATAGKFDIELVTEDVTTTKELEEALTRIPDNVDAVWLTCSYLLFSNVKKIVSAASARNLPVASSTYSKERSGILVTYGENDPLLGRQVSRLADKLLKGASPATTPAEHPEYILAVDLAAAQSLGLEVPDVLLRQATLILR